jgi:hypothetical protein
MTWLFSSRRRSGRFGVVAIVIGAVGLEKCGLLVAAGIINLYEAAALAQPFGLALGAGVAGRLFALDVFWALGGEIIGSNALKGDRLT